MQIEEEWGVGLRGFPCYVPAPPELPLPKTLEQSRRGAQAWLCCKLPGGRWTSVSCSARAELACPLGWLSAWHRFFPGAHRHPCLAFLGSSRATRMGPAA